MIKKIKFTFILLFLWACHGKEAPGQKDNLTPKVTDNGKRIVFPTVESISFFETETVQSSSLDAMIMAPAKVSATVIPSEGGASQNIVLFENQDLAANYTQLIQHLIHINQIQNINIPQKKIELERIIDLQQHGAATGRELLEARTALALEESNLANEKAANIENETKLIGGGFKSELLRKAPAGTAYIICDIPENQINKINPGSNCLLSFTSFPNEKFKGRIEDIAEMIDQTTRMVKLRVSINNANGKLKAGMFATVSFGVSEGNNMSIDKRSLITIQGEDYVFVKTSNTTFERREVNTGDQVDDRIIVYSGLKNNEAVAVKGVMQLKGLSFGY